MITITPYFKNPNELINSNNRKAKKGEINETIRNVVGTILADYSFATTLDNQLTQGTKKVTLHTTKSTFPTGGTGYYTVEFEEKRAEFNDKKVVWENKNSFTYCLSADLGERRLMITLMGTKVPF